jgi:hypothetical protein
MTVMKMMHEWKKVGKLILRMQNNYAVDLNLSSGIHNLNKVLFTSYFYASKEV